MTDPATDIISRLESAAETMAFADPRDLQSLAAVHTALEALRDWAADNHVLPVVKAAADLVEKTILGETDDPARALETVNNTIACLQHMAGHGVPAHEIDFPAELLPQPANTGQIPVSAHQPPAASGPCARPESGAAISDDKILAEFLARQDGVLARCEELILAMEKEVRDDDLDELRRIMHTIKGEAGLLGLPQVERLCHELEDLTQNRLPEGATELLLRAKDWLTEEFAFLAGKTQAPAPVDELLPAIKELASASAPDTADGNVNAGPEATTATDPSSPQPPRPIIDRESLDHALLAEFLGEAREHLENTDIQLLELETNPDDNEATAAVFRAFHTIKGVAGFLGLEEIGSLAHETESLLDRIRRSELKLTPQILDVIFDCVDALKKMRDSLETFLASGRLPEAHPDMPSLLDRVQTVAAGMSDPAAAAGKRAGHIEPDADTRTPAGRKLGELLVSAGAIDRDGVEAALATQRNTDPAPRLGEVLVKQEQVPAREVAKAIRTQQTGSRQSQARVRETLRVDADRLDRMVEMIGEMVIAESMVSRAIEQDSNRAEIMRNIGRLDKITRELQEIGMSLRMVPVRGVFQKMARLVRDLSRKSGKRVEFVMSGEDTELDKSVVDRIGDPLVHMVRNAVDHGIESDPATREAAGKPATGRVELRAFHRGGNIYIEIEDDGRGLDRDAIIAKAIERGLISSADNLSDREVWDLIFAPGFSTAKKITDVSGRGVGMDVVKRNIEALRGQIEVRSAPGKGSVISLRLPLTLAIIEGMALRVGDDRYFIPTLNIIRSLRPKPDEISTINGRGEMLYIHGKLLPLFRLKDIFAIPRAEDDPTRAIAMIIEDNGNEFALLVDELLGQQQVVIKNLGAGLEQTPGISGGAIMSDGRVGLILDPGGLMSLAHDTDHEQKKTKTTASSANAEEYIGDDILAKVG